MAAGTGGQIALIKQTSLYNYTDSVTLWTNFVSESLEHTLTELEEGSITGQYDAPPSHKGIDYGQGDVTMEPNPNALGIWLNAAMGTLASSLVTHGGSTGANSGSEAGKPQYFHRFTPRTSPFDLRTFLEPHGVMVYRDTGSAFMHNGAVVTGLEMNFQAGQLVSVTANLMSRQVRRIQRTTAIYSLVSKGGRPWLWDMVSVEVASGGIDSSFLTANANFEQITIGLTTPMEPVTLLDGTKFYAEFQPNDFRRVNISGTVSFRDQTEYDAFIAYEARHLRLTAMNVNSNLMLGNPASLNAGGFLGYYGLRIEIPRMKFLSWNAPISGPNRLQAQFTAKAEYSSDATAGYLMRADLLNVASTY